MVVYGNAPPARHKKIKLINKTCHSGIMTGQCRAKYMFFEVPISAKLYIHTTEYILKKLYI